MENITTSQNLHKLTFEPVNITVARISSSGLLCASPLESAPVSIDEMEGSQLF